MSMLSQSTKNKVTKQEIQKGHKNLMTVICVEITSGILGHGNL